MSKVLSDKELKELHGKWETVSKDVALLSNRIDNMSNKIDNQISNLSDKIDNLKEYFDTKIVNKVGKWFLLSVTFLAAFITVLSFVLKFWVD